VVPRAEAGAAAGDVDFPLLVKAAAGGGGMGMRIVRSPGELDAAVAAARREAASAFGDDTLLLEKYVEHGRHIEVQVLADGHGNVVHLFERDCSTQRRHQKVLEEAPAPTLSDETRRLVLDSAVALAAHVGYENAGTVEFLLDADSGHAYFLEMNTRLQVEHPVTESVVRWQTLEQRATGQPGQHVDLVALQLQVAAGQPLPFGQDDLSVHGHAIEARVYAEDPYAGFLPQAGTASLVRWPEDVRVDAALESGQVVSTAYDPMLGKVIAHGTDREAARRALVAALDDTAVLGLTTNTGFLRELAASDAFRDAEIDTAWLDRTELTKPDGGLARLFGAWTQAWLETDGDPGPWQADGWRLAGDPAPVVVDLDGPVVVDRARGRVDGHQVSQVAAERHAMQLIVDGTPSRAVVNVQPHFVEVSLHGQRWMWERPDVFADHGASAGDGTILAPMPGTVLEVRVAAGQTVAEGEVLGMMEAMKMELSLTAPFAGTVTTVEAAAGDQVALGATLFVVQAQENSEDDGADA